MAAKRKKRSSDYHMELRPVNPARQRRIKVYLSLFVLLALAGAWFCGELIGRHLDNKDQAELMMLREEVMLLQLDLQAARDELALHRTGAVVAEEAEGQVRDEIKELRTQLAELEEAVTFYKSVMSPGSVKQGLKIETFTLSAASDPGIYSYRLVLTQVGDNRRRISGNVVLTLQSGPQGELVEVPLASHLQEQSETTYRFRYYQELLGSFKLPENVVPEKVKVEVNVAGRRKDKQEKIFVWQLEK